MKNKIITIVITALVTAAATCVTISLTKSEPLTDWIKMAKMRLYGCSSPEVRLEKAKRIRGQMNAVGMHEPVGITIREGVSLPPDQSSAPEGVTLTPSATEIFVLVRDYSDDGFDVYEFDLMKIMCDKDTRKQIKELVIKTNARSNSFRCSSN